MLKTSLAAFEKLLLSLEELPISKDKIEQLQGYIKNSHIYSAFFESYLGTRIHQNIQPERLLNIVSYMEASKETYFFSVLVNRRLASSMLYRNEGFDQFYFLCHHDQRSDRHILIEFIKALSDTTDENILRIIDVIYSRIGIDKYALILKVLEEESVPYTILRKTELIERLELEEQFLILTKSIEYNSVAFNYISHIIYKMYDWIVNNHLIINGDKDIFAQALSVSNIPIIKFESCYGLSRILSSCGINIPQTMDRLYYRAEQEGRYEYLLTLGANKNKKELLQSIVKSKNHELIDKFFLIYKDYPEVKHLVPFI